MKKVFLLLIMMLGLSVAFNTMAQRSFYGEQAEKPSQHQLNLRLGEIVYDQSADEQYGGYIVSQYFTDPASADLTSQAADDFVVPEGETWSVGSFGVWGQWWPESAGNPEKVDVHIYADDDGKPGDTLYTFLEQTNFYQEEWFEVEYGEEYLHGYYNLAFPSAISFTEGHYWISFQVHDSYDKVGQFGWDDKTNTNWEVWHWRNPAGGFWNGGTEEWAPSNMVTPFGSSLDLRFALYGEAMDNDIALKAITSPVTGVLTATETVTIEIKNEGNNTQTGFDVAFAVDGGAMVTENVGILSIDSEGVAEYTFTATADLSATGFHTVTAYTLLVGDEIPGNDEATIDVTNYGTFYPMVNADTVDYTTCSGTFTDPAGVTGENPGGTGGVVTFYPEAGKKMKLDFFGTYDISHTVNGVKPLRIFDGPDMNSPLIGEWTQNDFRDYGLKPELVKALGATGAMTIRWMTPTWDAVEGFEALVACYEQPDNDFEVTSFTINPTLVFTDRDIVFTATVRNIGNLAQSKDVTFYVNGSAIGVVNTGEVQPTEYATVSYTHQFIESGTVVLKAAVPEDSGDTPENNYKTLNNYVYLNGWFIEMFDDGYFPPEDWTPGPSWSGTAAAYSGTGAAMSYVETFTEDTLVTPLLVIHEGDILTYYAKTSLWWPGNMKIIWKDSQGGPWQLIEYVEFPGANQFTKFQVDVSAAAGESYLGFVNVGDNPNSWGSEVVVDHVIGIGIEFYYFDNDMKMVEFNPNPTPSKSTPIDYDVVVKNNGHNAMAAGDYTVQIMKVEDGGDVVMASVPGIACNHLQEKTHTISVTFDEIGPAEIYAVVVLDGDEKPDNDVSIVRPVYVQVDGTVIVEVGDGETENSTIPNPLGTAWAVSEVIYPADLVNPTDATGYITGIAYEFNNTNTSPTLDVPILIYIGETQKVNLASGYINGTQLTKVAQTRVDLPMGLNQQLYIPFTVPYDYQGGNLCVMFFKPREAYYQGVKWLNTEMDDDSISAYSQSYNPPLDPNNMREAQPVYKNLIPNTSFYIADVGSVSLTGVVTDDATDPVEDVMVEVVGFENSTMTLADGSYELTDVLAWETVIKATKFGYYDNPQTIVLQEDVTNTLDFTMTLLPQVNVTAVVVGNDDPMHYLEGAEVTFEGYDNYVATVGADGMFAIPGVYGDKTYDLTIAYPGFDDYMASVDVSTTDLDLGIITLDESYLIPFYTQTQQMDPGTVKVNWLSPMDAVPGFLTFDYFISNGYAAEIGEEVWLGNIYEMDAGTITQVSMYWKQYGETSATVRLDLVDLEGNIFYSSEPFETVHNGWTVVDVPNITFEGGEFYAMAYWDGTNEVFTDYLAADAYAAGTGINNAYIMYPGAPPYPLSDLLTDLDITFQIDIDILTVASETGRYNEGYNIFRGPWADVNNSGTWEKINDEPVTGNEYYDNTWPQPEEGYTYGVQTIYTTGNSEASYSLPIVHTPGMTCGLPWTYTTTAQVHTISIPASADVNFFGEAMQTGDWIGVFFVDEDGEEVCGGAGKWGGPFGGAGAVVNAYGDDPTTPEKDGFAPGERFRWRMLDCDVYAEYPASATYNVNKPNQGNFADFGLSAITVLEVSYCQYFTFAQGWNSISAYIDPADPAVEVMFEPIVDQLTILRNLTQVYWPGEGINTMGNWNSQSGYVTKVTENTEFEVCGPGSVGGEVLMENAGWYYLPVLSECDVNAMDLFDAFLDDIIVVQDLIGTQVFWPAQGIYSLVTLVPGKAYKMKIANPITLNFPMCEETDATSTIAQLNKLSTPWGELNMTPSSQMVSFPAASLIEMMEGDMIGAFDQTNTLCGYMEIGLANMSQGMVLFGDDVTTIEKDGYTDGEAITFRVLRATGEEFNLEVVWDYNADNASGNFYSQSLSVVKDLDLGITGIGNAAAGLVDVYPNPATDAVVININAEKFETAEVSIIDTKGNVVLETRVHNTETTLNISSLNTGIYFVKINAEQFNKIMKLVVK